MDNINVTIGGPKKSLVFTYKTVLLRNNMDLEDQLFEQDTKYIIKWNFDLGGKTITIPENCILSFDGGVISNGTIVGLNTYIDNVGGLDNILEGVTLGGTWRETVDDELSPDSDKPIKNKAVYAAIEGIRSEMSEKGYSDNNFSTEEKNKLQNLPTSDELNSALNNKVSAVLGKGLSLNDFTNTLKDKLDSIESNAQANVLADWNEADSNSDSFIKNKPTLLNLSVDNNVANNTNNPVSSKAVKEYVDNVASNLLGSIDNKADASGLARVAQTGSYNDLTDKPNIASELVQADWNENDSSDKSYIRNKPNLALVAISGSYNDLTNKPTIQGIPQSVIDMVEGGPYLKASDIQNKADKTNATQSLAGLMSALDKEKLDNLTTDIEQALANKADKDYYATNEHGGLITADEKRKLSTIPSRGFSLDGTVSSVTINLVEKTPDSDGNVDLGEFATINPQTGKIPSNLLPEVNALGLGETSDKAFPGDRGKSLEDALEELSNGNSNMSDVLDSIVALLWPDGELNAAIVTALKAILDNHESRIKALEGGDNSDYPRIDYTNKFSNLITTFNNTSPIGGNISTNPNSDIYKYLYAYYSDAETEWKKASSPFFQRSNFQEIEGYNEVPGLKGTYKESYELAFDAMTAWLMAMCLSELKPSGNTIVSDDPTNNQTIFFETAYNYNGNGRSVPLYNNYDLHCDPMHARLIAGAIYARVRGKMNIDDVIAAREVLNGAAITNDEIINNRVVARENNRPLTAWEALGDMNCGFTLLSDPNIRLGYFVNSRKVIPNAPGPYVINADGRYDKPWDQGLPSGLFYMSELDGNDWSLYNYVVDYLADAKVRENYLMMVEYNGNADVYNANLQKIKSLWGIDGTTTSTYSYEKRTTILNAAVAFFALSRYFFGSRNVHLNALTKGTQTWNGESAAYTDYYMFKFIEGSTGGDQDYTLGGPFADIEDYVYSNKTSTGMNNPVYNFLDQVREAGDNARWPTYIPEYARRRRPLGSRHNGSNGRNARSTTFGSPLNGFNNYALRYYFAPSDNKGNNNEIGWPEDGAQSYPSGHASLTMTTALMLGQLYAKTNEDKLLYYMKKAYSVGVGRMITRAHWLSDVIYGRLFATMTLPILNATELIMDNYDTVLSTLTGTTPVGVGSARVKKGSSGGGGGSNTIDVYLHNNGNSAILIARVTFTLEANSGDPYPNNTSLEREAKYMFDPVTIPAGGAGVKVLSGVTISQFDYFNAVASNHKIIDVGLLEYNTAYISTYGGALVSMSSDLISQLSNIPFKNGMEYHIHFNGGTSTYSDNSSGGGGDGPGANKINILIINKTGVDVQLKNKIRFLVQNGTTVERTDAMTLGTTSPITIHAGDADGETFSNITLSAHDQNFIGRPFATSYNVEGRNYQSNIILYDPDDVNRVAPIMDASKYTFEDNATYEITLGGYTPPPSGKPTLELTIINTTLYDAIFSGEIRIYTTTESTADSAAQRLAEELLKRESICVDLPNCDVRKNRYKLAAGTSMTLTVNPYKAAGEGKSIEDLINSVDNIKFLTGSENWTDRTAPKIYVYAKYMNDDANHTIQTTHHTGFVVGTYEPGNTYLQWNNTGTIRINTVVPSTNNLVNPGDGTYTYSTD